MAELRFMAIQLTPCFAANVVSPQQLLVKLAKQHSRLLALCERTRTQPRIKAPAKALTLKMPLTSDGGNPQRNHELSGTTKPGRRQQNEAARYATLRF